MGRFFVSSQRCWRLLRPSSRRGPKCNWVMEATIRPDPAPVGFEVSPGVVFVPTVFSEIG